MIEIRELRAGDRPVVGYVFAHLGAESRYRRFLSAKRELGDADLEALTAVDRWHAEALVAWSPVPRAPIGIARYVRAEEFDVAEIAVAVADDWQRRQVGTELVRALRERALRAGIHRFSATLLRGNRPALSLVRRLGPYTIVGADGDVVDVVGSWR